MDIEEIWKSLPPGLTSYLDINLLDNTASLTLEGIYALEPDAPEFALFLWVLDLCLKTYAASQDDTVRSEDILQSHPQWNEAEVKKMGWLLFSEGNLWQSFSGPHPQSGSWAILSPTESTAISRYNNDRCILEEAGVTPPSTSNFAASRLCSNKWRHLT